MPGPPFAFGAILVILALIVALFIPENPHACVKSPSTRRAPAPLLQSESDVAETSIVLCFTCHTSVFVLLTINF